MDAATSFLLETAGRTGARHEDTWRTWPLPLRWPPLMIAPRDVSITWAKNHPSANWNGHGRSQMRCGWEGKFVVLPVENTPPHLLRPGNTAQHWTVSSARIRQELGYEEPIAIDEAIRRTIRWEEDNPPADVFQGQFDYAAENAAVAD